MPRRKNSELTREQQEQQFMAYRIRMLPEQLDRARRRVAQLEREAARLGMNDLLGGGA